MRVNESGVGLALTLLNAAGGALPAEGTETRDEWGPTDLRRAWLFSEH